MSNTLKKEIIKLAQQDRLYEAQLPIIGLTGGIATGKSTVSKILESKGFKIIDADQMVKSIYQTQEAINFIKDNFSIAWNHNQINFQELRNIFFKNPEAKLAIESFIYQRLPSVFRQSLLLHDDQEFLIYDVPLLFEKNLEHKFDFIVVVYAPKEIQIERLLKRDHCSAEIAEQILNQQTDIEQKKRKADFVINNTGNQDDLAVEINKLLLQILN